MIFLLANASLKEVEVLDIELLHYCIICLLTVPLPYALCDLVIESKCNLSPDKYFPLFLPCWVLGIEFMEVSFQTAPLPLAPSSLLLATS